MPAQRRCVPARGERPTRADAAAASDSPSPGKAGSPLRPEIAEVPLDPPVGRHQLLIGQRPVVRDALARAQPEIRRHVAMPLCREDDHRPADAVPHQRRDIGFLLVDRLVPDTLTKVRPPVPLRSRPQLEVGLPGPHRRAVGPLTSLQHDDGEAILCQPSGGHGARRPCADDADVDFGSGCVRDGEAHRTQSRGTAEA